MEPFWHDLPPWPNLILGVVVGFGISLGIAQLVVPCFKEYLRRKLPSYDEERDGERIPPKLTGFVERLVFTVFVIAQPTLALPVGIAWVGFKMAANWNKSVLTVHDPEQNRAAARFKMLVWNRHAFLGLLVSFVSVSFAWSGGMVARWIMRLENAATATTVTTQSAVTTSVPSAAMDLASFARDYGDIIATIIVGLGGFVGVVCTLRENARLCTRTTRAHHQP